MLLLPSLVHPNCCCCCCLLSALALLLLQWADHREPVCAPRCPRAALLRGWKHRGGHVRGGRATLHSSNRQGGNPAFNSQTADTALQNNPLKQLQLRGHDDAITAFAMSPNGALLATGQRGQNADVIVWSTQTLAQQFRFQVRMTNTVHCSQSLCQ
jgi:hypothetical protein